MRRRPNVRLAEALIPVAPAVVRYNGRTTDCAKRRNEIFHNSENENMVYIDLNAPSVFLEANNF